MEQFINECRNTNNPKTLKANLSKFEEVLERSHQNLDAALGHLDPKLQSLGYLFVLNAKISDPNKNINLFVGQIQNFFLTFAPEQIKVAGTIVCRVARHFTEYLIKLKLEIKGIAPLKRVINSLTDKPTQLTPVHSDFLQLCILSKNYSLALPVIDAEVNEFNVEQTQINIKDILTYFYYAGIIYATLKNYKKALDAFKFVFTAPATALSSIAIEAYKKYVLIHLIEYGVAPSFPRITSNVVQRNIKTHCKPYIDFSTTYSTNNQVDIQTKALQNEESFKRDKNFGLVNLAIKSITRRNIKKLTQTFMTLSIRDISEKVGLPPAKTEQFVLKMIEDKEIFATINQKDGMVSFNENPEDFSGPQTLLNLEKHIQKVAQLESVIRSVDETLTLSTPFLKKLLNENRKQSMFVEGGIEMDENQ
ncbi:proteasome component region PCI domain-containing protein [Tieghemostelium lacteum]|uniref:COP9 signalosome complex subunit 3 n=1 Tax=Tieghemostelium lacteum TaxID=361077 RepID=A0A152A9Y8_TIELA|nr:proteasome component region PCI domain-containing protein [Tieghemostelium lacteum]|eukprot:KYR02941.1 proteasome component region PCI domain-containing protein [Tieghemostelium lacteum]